MKSEKDMLVRAYKLRTKVLKQKEHKTFINLCRFLKVKTLLILSTDSNPVYYFSKFTQIQLQI